MANTRILITGFEPFANSTQNPSLEVIAQIEADTAWLAYHRVATATLPVETATVAKRLQALLDKHDPAVVIMLGESAKASAVTLERLAVNLLDFRLPDNQGITITDQPVEHNGPTALWATLPVKEIAEIIPDIALSMSAGTYLCNQVMYLALRWAQRAGGDRRVGFVHLPSLPTQVASGERCEPSLPVEKSTRRVRAIVEIIFSRNAELH